MNKDLGLVLSGGGARGAYQVGVIMAAQQISHSSGVPLKFDYLSGVSAGAINASSLASNAENLHFATSELVRLWSELSFEKVFSTDSINMGKIGFQWFRDLSIGAMTGTTPGKSLMDTAPLRHLIHSNMNYAKVEENLRQGHFKGLAVTAIDYVQSATTTFIQGHKDIAPWDKGRKRSEFTRISTDHIMASSAIPLLFPPVKVGPRYFGDGAVRNHAPCSPVIYMGAQKILIIGVRMQRATAHEERAHQDQMAPSVARVINTVMNGVLLDAVEQDVDRLRRSNDLARMMSAEQRKMTSLRPVDYLLISPSADIGEMAVQKANKLPRMVRFLLKGLGSLQDASELISYLLFDPEFCADLIEIGYKDGLAQKEELLRLMDSK